MPPDREQKLAALELANDVRHDTAQLRQRIHAAGRRQGALLAASTVIVGTSPIRFYTLLVSVPYLGHKTARRILAGPPGNPFGISEMARVNSRNITRHQRERLAADLRAWGRG